MTVFEKAKWIWTDKNYGNNDYAEFCEKINYETGSVTVCFSVSGEYTLFVNGNYVSSVQYADFEHYKVYEEIDITAYLEKGENSVCFLCCYWGKSGMRYLTPTPGIIFEIRNGEKLISYTNESTMSRKSLSYVSGWNVIVSTQLGYSFSYDASKEDEWLVGKGSGFSNSIVIEKECKFVERPIKKQVVEALRQAKPHGDKKKYIFDLGKEYCGFCSFSINSKTEQNIKVFYGEILKDGHVKKKIGNRNFRFDYKTCKGKNKFTNYMLRLACRFIEIECEDEIDVDYIGILPQVYPVTAKKAEFENKLDKDIYEICLYTLKLSMLEHYVDCPWREQCLYAFDSRNQMLTGYYAYGDGNFEYARANLALMSKDRRSDNLLSICFPSGEDLTIPSFCLYYVLAVKEYIIHSGDCSLAEEVFDKMVSVMSVFVDNMKDGLICKFQNKSHWNFYDWSEYASGTIHESESAVPDCLINAIAVIALDSFDVICQKIGKDNPFSDIAERIKIKINEKFYNSQNGYYFVVSPEEKPTELVNCLCVLAGVADKKTAESICEKMLDGGWIECSLSMKPFKYDALLSVDEKYSKNILCEIRNTYKVMLDEGSSTVWETKDGESAFGSAGSLCHGWSAVPIYYYHLLKNNGNLT